MKNRLLLFFVFLLCAATAVQADVPYRNHRYSAFTALKVDETSIVFVGNSITNMHEWWEAFGCQPNILNRGVSGSYSDEVLANLENIITGRPAKIFFMIGTNDIGDAGNSPAVIADHIRKIVRRVQLESPSTQVYLQSVLPSTIGKRTLALEQQTNDSLKVICQEMGLEYVDLWDLFTDIPSADGTKVSNDGLHLSKKGFSLWCNKIAPILGFTPVYTNAANQYGGIRQSYGLRVTAFGDLPIEDGDILFVGDELIHGGEWHELLNSTKVKDRGNDWDYPGRPLSVTLSSLPIILKGRAGNGEPSKVFLYAGVREVNANSDQNTTMNEYKQLVSKIRELAPNTQILLMAHLPQTTASVNTNKVVPFNKLLQELAASSTGVTYVDTYTPFVKDGVANTAYMMGNYLSGRGYNKLANVVAAYLAEDGVSVMSESQADSLISLYEARNQLGSTLTSMGDIAVGKGVGQYNPEGVADFLKLVESGYTLLRENGEPETLKAKAAEIMAARSSINAALNMPEASTESKEVWYTFCAALRSSRYITASAAAGGVVGGTTDKVDAAKWKFVERTDGSGYDIVNREYGTYLSPSAAYNTQVKTVKTQPSRGWTLSYADACGLYIISSKAVELNQTGDAQSYKIYNWSSERNGTDRTDQGCQFRIEQVDIASDPEITLPQPAYETTFTLNLDGKEPFRIPDEQADKIKGDQLTIYVDFTEANVSSTNRVLISSSDEDGTEFFSLFGATKYGVRYTSNTTGAADQFTLGGTASSDRSQLILLVDNNSRHYVLYQNGALLRDFSGAVLAEGAQWEYRTLGNVKGQSAMYIGGVKLGSGFIMPFSGIVHDVRIWDSVLSEEQIAQIKVRDHTTSGLTKTATDLGSGNSAVYDLQGRRATANGHGVYVVDGKKFLR